MTREATLLNFALATALMVLPSAVQSQTADLNTLRRVSTAGPSGHQFVTELSDRYGPRMAGSRQYKSAAIWTVSLLREWGLRAETSPIDFPLRGWESQGHSLELIEPAYRRLTAHPLPHTASTPSPRTSQVVVVAAPEELPTLGDLSGKVVALAWTYRPGTPGDAGSTSVLSDDVLRRAEANPDPNEVLVGYHSRRPTTDAIDGWRDRRASQAEVVRLLTDAGVSGILISSSRPLGILQVDNNSWLEYLPFNDDPVAPPTFVVAQSDFGHLLRLGGKTEGAQVRLESRAERYFDPTANINVIADLPGADRADELVIIGAHLDAHPAGLGAADNGAGVAAVLEAARLIARSGLAHRRTIRIALWAGEEGGFYGSRAYVATRVGDLRSGALKAEHSRISAVLNLDNGPGKIRGVFAQGNDSAAAAFRDILRPFRTENAPGSGAVTLQNSNQTDHEVFDALGIPAFQFIQDPMGYIPWIHHTQFDTPEMVRPADVDHNALIIAWTAISLANREDMLGRRPYHSITPRLAGSEEFRLAGHQEAKAVHIVSSFNNWQMFDTPLRRTENGWVTKLDLPPGRYLYKFIVDGMWTNDPTTAASAILRDGEGHGGLTERIVTRR